MWLPKLWYVGGRSESPNPYLTPDHICSSSDGRQLIKAGAVTQSCLWALSISIRDFLIKQIVTSSRQLINQSCFMGFFLFYALWPPLLFPLPSLGVNTQFQRLSFPDGGNDTQNFKGCPPPALAWRLLWCWKHLAILSNQAQDCWVSGWDLPPSCSLPWFTIHPT